MVEEPSHFKQLSLIQMCKIGLTFFLQLKPSNFLGNPPGRDGEQSAASAPIMNSPWPRNAEAAGHSTPEPKGGLLLKKLTEAHIIIIP
jgi:hypothetical protein